MGFKWRVEYGLLLLVLLSVAAVRFSDAILLRTHVIVPGRDLEAESLSDRSDDGDSDVWRGPGPAELNCILRQRFAYPYCGLVMRFDPKMAHGLDFSDMRHMRMWLDYEGPGDSLQAHLRNANPRYGLPTTDQRSAKYNQIDFETKALRGGMIQFDLADFSVAPWWLTRYHIPPNLRRPEFNNIVQIEIVTGTPSPTGHYRLVLHKVEYDLQWLSTERWYLAIMSVWLMLALIYLMQRSMRLQDMVGRQRRQNQELREINKVLDARSKQLAQMATTDALTGAFNRKGLENVLQQALADWRQRQHPFGVVLIDVDHFKAVNDTYGHQAGDRVLAGLAELVRRQVRGQDLLGRWGGEEFLLVCRDTSRNQALAIAEKLRRLVAEQDFGDGLRVTASFGVAALDGERPLEQLFAAADAALYRAKAEGRNRVIAEG